MVRDYQDFTTIDTPVAERRRYYVGDIWSNSAVCLTCNEEIRSKNKHDFVSCSCGSVAVDGGSWYCKRNFKSLDGYRDTSVPYNKVPNEKPWEML